MIKQNLHFFDKDGYNLNFDWNEKGGYWEGIIYLPKVSVGLYANSTIYVLEETDTYTDNSDDSNSYNDIVTNYTFPLASKEGDKIVFTWDRLNKFVDEFFMFNFDTSYIIQETSSLIYTPNDGPDCETLIINRFDEYEIPLSTKKDCRTLPIYVAFSANEKYDATTYARTLIMSYNNETVAKIKFYAETVEEDERLKIWNSNLGYNIKPEDSIIFYTSDIKESKPDYQIINEKRKELMMEGSNIYPYIGSYKAIINAIKFFGYNNLGIIEYWKNVNPSDINFGKIYHSSRYSLTKKETLRVGARTIKLPNKNYKKNNQLALVYSINQPTGKVDEWELPLMEEKFSYTIEEALIKLFALRKKLNKEFMPGNSRIIDIIGEGNYFGIHGIKKIYSDFNIFLADETNIRLDFEVGPDKYLHLTDDRYFNNYIVEKGYTNKGTNGDNNQFNVIENISNISLEELSNEGLKYSGSNPSNPTKAKLYLDYYNEVFVDFTRYEDINLKDDASAPSSAKVVLTDTSQIIQTFGNSQICFGYIPTDLVKTGNEYNIQKRPDDVITFDNVDIYKDCITSWEITMSDNQYDEDFKNIEKAKEYTKKNFKYITTGTQVYVQLPYVGYYDVKISFNGYEKIKRKCIKIEPYNLELKGFYYDARELPDDMKCEREEDLEMFNFIQDKLRDMTAWAVTERTSTNHPIDFSMPTYGINLKNEKYYSIPTFNPDIDDNPEYLEKEVYMINKGPYVNMNLYEEWYLADNYTSEVGLLIPIVNNARYIRNGVDVKPYTWFILGYEYSKIVGKVEPTWCIINNQTGVSQEYKGKYLTCLLKEVGNYTIKLSIKDNNGNEYDISRNIFVVNKTANGKIYQPFRKEYDYFAEEQELLSTKNLQSYNL